LASEGGVRRQERPETLFRRAASDGALGCREKHGQINRLWSQAADVVSSLAKKGGYSLTILGSQVLGNNGFDPFLEDVQTLWLIHWNLSTNVEDPLLAWDYLLNRAEPEIIPSVVITELEKQAAKQDAKLSTVTVRQHFETFVHTYVPTRGRKGEIREDNLDCPLVELEFLLKIGDRQIDAPNGRREPIYAFRREEKPPNSTTWDKLAGGNIDMDFDVVMHPLLNEEGNLERIFINMDSAVLRNYFSKQSGLSVENKELAEKKYISSVYFHTIFLFSITKNRNYELKRDNKEVDLGDYLKDVFSSYYGDFLLNFGAEQLMASLAD
jgi:hypothetical protein